MGTPQELIRSLGAEHVIEFTAQGAIDPRELEHLPGVSRARTDGDGVALNVREPHVAIPALLHELSRRMLPLAHLTTHHATLEDVFMNLTGRTLRDE